MWYAVAVIMLVLYLTIIRPWQLRWGATDAEVARPMAGDDLVQSPTFNATRAVTVAASADEIWPWLVQIGFGRAGWYSYDWVDNLGRPSARQIIPALQHLEIGQLVPLFGQFGFRVKAFESGRYVLWEGDNTTWYWGLYPAGDGTTRLVTRVRLHYVWWSPTILFNLMLDVGDIIMMRKCLLGIKERAEAKTA